MKLLASLVASAALALSMLVALPTTSTAAPYPGTVSTTCSYAQPGAIKRGNTLRVAFRVRTAGNGRPRGYVSLRVYKIVNNRFRFNRQVTYGNNGQSLRRVSLGKFKKRGTYTTLMQFKPTKGSVYDNCSNGPRRFRVTRR